EAGDRADDADGGAGDQKHAHHRALGRPHGAQDGDVVAFVLHQHDQAGDDVERGYHHDQSEDQEHHVALDLERAEEGAVALAPIDHEDRPAGGLAHLAAELIDPIGIGGVDLDAVDAFAAVEIGLRLGQRHEYDTEVVFGHAYLEHRGGVVRLDARGRAHGGDRAARRDHGYAVASVHRELLSEAPADREPLPRVEIIERTL